MFSVLLEHNKWEISIDKEKLKDEDLFVLGNNGTTHFNDTVKMKHTLWQSCRL